MEYSHKSNKNEKKIITILLVQLCGIFLGLELEIISIKVKNMEVVSK